MPRKRQTYLNEYVSTISPPEFLSRSPIGTAPAFRPGPIRRRIRPPPRARARLLHDPATHRTAPSLPPAKNSRRGELSSARIRPRGTGRESPGTESGGVYDGFGLRPNSGDWTFCWSNFSANFSANRSGIYSWELPDRARIIDTMRLNKSVPGSRCSTSSSARATHKSR